MEDGWSVTAYLPTYLPCHPPQVFSRLCLRCWLSWVWPQLLFDDRLVPKGGGRKMMMMLVVQLYIMATYLSTYLPWAALPSSYIHHNVWYKCCELMDSSHTLILSIHRCAYRYESEWAMCILYRYLVTDDGGSWTRYIHTYIHTYIPTYINMYIHTYIHTYLP